MFQAFLTDHKFSQMFPCSIDCLDKSGEKSKNQFLQNFVTNKNTKIMFAKPVLFYSIPAVRLSRDGFIPMRKWTFWCRLQMLGMMSVSRSVPLR